MATIYDVADKHRAALDAGDRRAANQLVEAYGQAWARIEPELRQTVRRIAEAQAAGEPVSPAWLYRERRLENLLAELEGGIRTFAAHADAVVQQQQAAAVTAAGSHAHQLIEAGLEADGTIVGSFTRLPEEALRDLIGSMADGSPLAELFDAMPSDAGAALRQALAAGVARGSNPRQMVREVRDALDTVTRARALTIARTETLRAYREASRRHYEASTVVGGWVWISAHDRRTCAACWAMHGTTHPVAERLDGHPNCRCAMAPLTGPAAERLLDRLGTGPDLFDKLPEADQRAILGPAKLRAYQAGDLELADVVGRTVHPRWGSTRGERSLRSILREREEGRDTRAFRLGTGVAKRPPRGPSKRAARDAELADALGVDPERVKALRATLHEQRARIRAEAAEVAYQAGRTLESLEGGILRAPKRSVRRLNRARGTVEQVRAGELGNYDWFDSLHPDEQKRLRRRWMADGPGRPGVKGQVLGAGDMEQLVEDRLGSTRGMDEWLDLTRQHDAALTVARGRIPARDAYGRRIAADDLAPGVSGEGWDVEDLLSGDDERALRHVLDRETELDELAREQELEWAERDAVDQALAPSTTGPPPWRMTADAYADECEQLLARINAGDPTDVELDRLAELMPDDLLELAEERNLGWVDLHRLILEREDF